MLVLLLLQLYLEVVDSPTAPMKTHSMYPELNRVCWQASTLTTTFVWIWIWCVPSHRYQVPGSRSAFGSKDDGKDQSPRKKRSRYFSLPRPTLRNRRGESYIYPQLQFALEQILRWNTRIIRNNECTKRWGRKYCNNIARDYKDLKT